MEKQRRVARKLYLSVFVVLLITSSLGTFWILVGVVHDEMLRASALTCFQEQTKQEIARRGGKHSDDLSTLSKEDQQILISVEIAPEDAFKTKVEELCSVSWWVSNYNKTLESKVWLRGWLYTGEIWEPNRGNVLRNLFWILPIWIPLILLVTARKWLSWLLRKE